jgi:hypothetical protein
MTVVTRIAFLLLLAGGLSGLLSSCNSSGNTSDALNPVPGADNSGFSKPLTTAMPQMSDAEAAKMSKDLSALAQGRRDGTISEAEYWRRVREMQALAGSNAE